MSTVLWEVLSELTYDFCFSFFIAVIIPHHVLSRKLSKMLRAEAAQDDQIRRRIIVFWIVDPERPDGSIVSSKDVPPQQESMPREAALRYRLEMMEERRNQKQNFNIVPVELCEH